MKSLFCLMLLFIIVTGCAAPSQIMINPTTKHQANCSTFGFGWLGTPVAIANYQDCVSRYKTLGYVPLEEFEKSEAPKLERQGEVKAPPCLQPVWTENSEWHYLINGRGGYLKVFMKEDFKGQTVYRVTNALGKFLLYNEALGVAARLDKDNNIEREYTPPLRPYDWPLSVGKTWNATGTMKTSTGTMNLSTHYEVKGYGKVKVPAGDFDAYYLLGKSDTGGRVVEIWYSPEVKNYVKAISYIQTGPILEELTSYNHPKLSTTTSTPKKEEIEEKIETLNNLLKKGLINQEEYNKKKAELLEKF